MISDEVFSFSRKDNCFKLASYLVPGDDVLMFQARRLHLKLTRVDPGILEGGGPEPRFIIRTQCKAKMSLQLCRMTLML